MRIGRSTLKSPFLRFSQSRKIREFVCLLRADLSGDYPREYQSNHRRINPAREGCFEEYPRVAITKQLFTQFVMDVFHLFEHLKADDMTEIVKAIHAITTFEELVSYIKETLTKFFGQYRMNENVVSVLEVIGRDYQKELSLKDISKDLFINPVYLGQLIKRETNSTFAELLNKQRIKAAQQLLLSTSDSIEDICYAVGYSNVGYFYKVFRKLCGKSPKAYRKQVETSL